MCGYIVWIENRVGLFRELSPDSFAGEAIRDHDAFTDYLFI